MLKPAGRVWPLTSEDRAHAKIEGPSGSRKPVSLFVCALVLVLRVKVVRPVRVVLEWHLVSGGETVEAART